MPREKVAVINTSVDVCQVLEEALGDAGHPTCAAFVIDFRENKRDLGEFFAKEDPRAIVWDVAIPYEENWRYFEEVRARDDAKGRCFVITTTNKRALESLVGATHAFEIIGKPYDLEVILDAVKRALKACER